MPTKNDRATVIARYNVRSQEIQWRGIQRDATMVFALVLCGTMAPSGFFALLAPVPLLFLAAMWLRHNRRIGTGALYLRRVVEPAMHDELQGYEEFVDGVEVRRSHSNRFNFSAITARAFFPTLQMSMVILGVYQYIASNHHSNEADAGVTVLAFVGLAIITVTFMKVKHERSK
jgi:hypothetical protein